MKKIIVFGGGTGLSCLLSGLKLFPMDVTTVIAVSDNGSSTGILKEELDIPAVGDIGKVLLSMANVDKDFVDLLRYRFDKQGTTLHNHPIRNIMLAALIDLKGNLTDATKYMEKLLNIKGTILPLTEEKVDLVGESINGNYVGEEAVSQNIRNIKKLRYDKDISIRKEILDAIRDADLILFSSGSLYTSILPHLIVKDVHDAIQNTSAPIMYLSNLVTQPGETDGYNVSDHLKVLNRYLYPRKIDVVVANNGSISEDVKKRYIEMENKTVVCIDLENVDAEGAAIIADDIFTINEEHKIRHDELKTAFLIFSYLMGMEK